MQVSKVTVTAKDNGRFSYREDMQNVSARTVLTSSDGVIGWRVNVAGAGGGFKPFNITFKDKSPFSWTTMNFDPPPGRYLPMTPFDMAVDKETYEYTVTVLSNGWVDDPDIQIDDGGRDVKSLLLGIGIFGVGMLAGLAVSEARQRNRQIPPSE
jgi:hypothetical protein